MVPFWWNDRLFGQNRRRLHVDLVMVWDFRPTEFGFVVKIGIITKIDDQRVWVYHNGGLPRNENIRLFYHFEIEEELEVIA